MSDEIKCNYLNFRAAKSVMIQNDNLKNPAAVSDEVHLK